MNLPGTRTAAAPAEAAVWFIVDAPPTPQHPPLSPSPCRGRRVHRIQGRHPQSNLGPRVRDTNLRAWRRCGHLGTEIQVNKSKTLIKIFHTLSCTLHNQQSFTAFIGIGKYVFLNSITEVHLSYYVIMMIILWVFTIITIIR